MTAGNNKRAAGGREQCHSWMKEKIQQEGRRRESLVYLLAKLLYVDVSKWAKLEKSTLGKHLAKSK